MVLSTLCTLIDIYMLFTTPSVLLQTASALACEANGVLKTVIVSNAFALQVYLPGPVLVCFVIIPDSRLLAMHP